MSTAGLVVLALLWQEVRAAFLVSVMAMVTLSKVTAITKQASATAPITVRVHTVSPACLATMETPGMSCFNYELDMFFVEGETLIAIYLFT